MKRPLRPIHIVLAILAVATIIGFIFLWAIVSFTGLGASLNNLLATVGLTSAEGGVQGTFNFAATMSAALGLDLGRAYAMKAELQNAAMIAASEAKMLYRTSGARGTILVYSSLAMDR